MKSTMQKKYINITNRECLANNSSTAQRLPDGSEYPAEGFVYSLVAE